MITIGIDAHKQSHTAVACDEVGRQVAAKTVAATSEGHFELVRWARQWPDRRWAVEDCRHLTRRLEADLLCAGERLLRVSPRLMAEQRRSGRQRGKSDPIDALAVARAALREPDLPFAELDGPAREVRLLVDHREALVRERTRVQSRLRWHLHELDPELAIAPKALRRASTVTQVRSVLAHHDGLVAELARDLLDRCEHLNTRVNELERRIRPLVEQLAPSLLAIPGCGTLSAAKIVGETAGAARFRSKAAFARFNGTAPIPVWSGNSDVQRLNRGGNRQVNAAVHRIAVTQLRGLGPGLEYVKRKTAAGDTRRDAVRALKRRLSDVIYRALLADEPAQRRPPTETLAQAA